jgi:hypothetical protein
MAPSMLKASELDSRSPKKFTPAWEHKRSPKHQIDTEAHKTQKSHENMSLRAIPHVEHAPNLGNVKMRNWASREHANAFCVKTLF